MNRLAHIVADNPSGARIRNRGCVVMGVDDSGVTVADMGERALIARFTDMSRQARTLTPGDADRLLVGPGDDAAVIALAPDLVVSTDSLVQDRHFRLEWSDPLDIGRRAAVQAMADIAAMGARCSAIVAAIACPPTTSAALVLDVDQGLNDAAGAVGARVVGGDLVSADQMVVTITAFGSTDGRRPVTVSGARVGDTLAVSGPLGSSAAGLALLRSGVTEYPALVAAHRVPIVDLAQGVVAAGHDAHAMTDVSDGLVDELRTIARASGVSVAIESAAVPVADDLGAAARALRVDPMQWVIGGGEDHQLLAAFAGAVPAGWTAIGSVVDRDDTHPVRIDGSAPTVAGWQSF